MEPNRVLVVAGDRCLAELWALAIQGAGCQADTACAAAEALSRAGESAYGLVVLDLSLPDLPGALLVPLLRELRPDADCLVVADSTADPSAIEAMNQGASLCLARPVHPEALLAGIARASETRRTREQRQRAAAALLDRERRAADTLQHGILPEIPPAVAGLEIATLYRAAADEGRVGGDFYDLFTVPPHRVAVVIGDVSGKGLEAAVQAAMVRWSLRSYAFEDPSPASVLHRLNRLLYAQMEPEAFATLVYALLDAADASLRYANAGHETPFLRHAGRDEAVLVEAGGPAAGAIGGAAYEEGTAPWLPGSLLFLYTDGLSGARRSGGFLGIEGARRLFSRNAAGSGPQQVVEAVYRDLMEYARGSLRDDVALLAVRAPLSG